MPIYLIVQCTPDVRWATSGRIPTLFGRPVYPWHTWSKNSKLLTNIFHLWRGRLIPFFVGIFFPLWESHSWTSILISSCNAVVCTNRTPDVRWATSGRIPTLFGRPVYPWHKTTHTRRVLTKLRYVVNQPMKCPWMIRKLKVIVYFRKVFLLSKFKYFCFVAILDMSLISRSCKRRYHS
jgi:hypothetical protein